VAQGEKEHVAREQEILLLIVHNVFDTMRCVVKYKEVIGLDLQAQIRECPVYCIFSGLIRGGEGFNIRLAKECLGCPP